MELWLGSRDPRLLLAESTEDGETWHASGQSTGAHTLEEFVLISAMCGEVSRLDVAPSVSLPQTKIYFLIYIFLIVFFYLLSLGLGRTGRFCRSFSIFEVP